jgi:hypothetical protein
MGLQGLHSNPRLKFKRPRPAWLGPMSSTAARVRRHRERRAAGRLFLTLDVDEISTIEVLCGARLLDPQQDHTRADIARAVEQLLAMLARDL